MKKHKIAVVGLGKRGKGWTKHLFKRPDVSVVGICDLFDERIEEILNIAKEENIDTIKYVTKDYKELLDKDIEIVLIATYWETHVPLSIDFMKAGIITACEVAGAYSVKDCYDLVDVYEETKTPFFFMENCCFGKRETMIKNMVNAGLFGEVVHCAGRYGHDLREEIVSGRIKKHYRQRNYKYRNCENYPTHELGPIAKILNINSGNRMTSLVSIASKQAGLTEFAKERYPEENSEFLQGDIVTTIITCALGQTITITLDTNLPRPYSRGFEIRGTKGMYYEDTDMIYLDSLHYPEHEFSARPLWENAKEFEKEYMDDVWNEDFDTSWGHDGMDVVMFSKFLKCVEEKMPMPVDIYDAVSLMAITALSEDSIRMGGAVVAIPDFTKGKWIKHID